MEEHPILDEAITKFHTALDFKQNKVWVTLPLPTKTPQGGLRYEMWVINSEREKFRLNEMELSKRKLIGKVSCEPPEDRWSRGSLKSWLTGSTNVKIKDIFLKIQERFKYYLDYPDPRLYTLLPIWIISTYFFPIFNAFPIILLVGVSGAGKSKTIEVANPLVFNAIYVTNISDASFFRIIDLTRGTLLLDENEKIAGSPEGLTQINHLLGSFKKSASCVLRTGKRKDGSFVQEKFELYAPKLIANIQGVQEEALLNRCILIYLTPSKGSEQSKREVLQESKRFGEIRDLLYVYMMNNWSDVNEARKEIKCMDIGLSGYELQVWLPILTIASLIGDNEFLQMKEMSLEKTDTRKEDFLEQDEQFRLFLALKRTLESKEDALRVSGEELFFKFETIRLNYLAEMGIVSLSGEERHTKYSIQHVGRMFKKLGFGKGTVIAIDGKNVRGRWLNTEMLRTIQQRFGYPDKKY